MPKVTGDAMQPGGAVSQILSNYKPHWPKKAIYPGVACQLCWLSSGEKVIAQI